MVSNLETLIKMYDQSSDNFFRLFGILLIVLSLFLLFIKNFVFKIREKAGSNCFKKKNRPINDLRAYMIIIIFALLGIYLLFK